MLLSEGRIRVTHAGSLPRPRSLVRLLVARSRREAVDEPRLEEEVKRATRDAVRLQLDAGIDVGNDGEQGRESFFTYVQHRMTGFGGESRRPVMRDLVRYPGFVEARLGATLEREMVNLLRAPKAIGEVRHVDLHPLERDIARFHRALGELGRDFAETFMTAASPGIVATAMENEFYDGLEPYLRAVAEALRPEYERIVSRGLVLQIDAPDLAMERHTSFADRPLREFLGFVEQSVAALNRAIERIPQDRVRLHVCWGNYEGPHDLDVPLDDILLRLYDARVGALVVSLANPRHEHEVRCFERHPLPDRMALVAGVIDTTTSYVEHPEVVAARIERAARAVGDPSRVLAGTDCGFDTAAGLGDVAADVAAQKLAALRAGADLATTRLF